MNSSRPMNRVFDHIIIIMFENEYRSYVMANPYMRWLAGQGIDMANYHGVMHPSQPNYIASVAGQLCGVTNDGDPRAQGSGAILDAPCLVDLMQPRDAPQVITWKGYMDKYPGSLSWVDKPPYYTKHNPFYMFDSVQSDPDRMGNIVGLDELWTDLANGTLPQYAWVTPDIWNDGHYLEGTTSMPNIRYLLVNQLATWLEHDMFGPAGLDLFGSCNKLPASTLVVVTFDEADYESNPFGTEYEGPNQIYTVLLGNLDAIVPGTVTRDSYNHYSLLRTVEDNFGLGSLGTNDAAANSFRFLANEYFGWSAPRVIAPPERGADGTFTPMATSSGIALGTYADKVYLISQGDGIGDTPYWSTFDGKAWTAQQTIDGVDTLSGPMVAAGNTSGLVVAYFNAGVLSYTLYTLDTGWARPTVVPDAGAVFGPLALAAFDDERALMLVFHTAVGLSSMIYRDGTWSSPVQLCPPRQGWVSVDSPLALSESGNILMLVFQSPDRKLMGLTYSLASYNTMRYVDHAVQFPSAAGVWSVNPAALAYYPGTPELPLPDTFSTTGALAMADLDGGLYLSWSFPEPVPQQIKFGQFYPSDWVHWSCYSLAGVLTTDKPLILGNTDGLLNQASWSPPEKLTGAPLRLETGTIAMARLGQRLVLVFGPADALPKFTPQPTLNYLFVAFGAFATLSRGI